MGTAIENITIKEEDKSNKGTIYDNTNIHFALSLPLSLSTSFGEMKRGWGKLTSTACRPSISSYTTSMATTMKPAISADCRLRGTGKQ
jgi:hypothetical protein